MTTPIPNCPQGETPIRERAWTAEQTKSAEAQAVIEAYLDWDEAREGVCTSLECFKAGVAYAATLRSTTQQGAIFDRMPEVRGWLDDYADMIDDAGHPEQASEVRAVVSTLRQQTTNSTEIGSKLVGQQGEQAVCVRCGASSSADASTKCMPDGDSCPGCENPLSDKWQAEKAGGVSDTLVCRALAAYNKADFDSQVEPTLKGMRAALEAVAPLLRAHAGQGGRVDEGVPGLCERNPAPNASPPMAATSPTIRLTAALAQNAQPQHPDDAAVDRFAAALKAKLAEARAKGRGGWQDKDDCPQQRLSDMLRAHVEKGDPRDVGNFAMFLHQRGEAILPAQNAQVEAVAEWQRKCPDYPNCPNLGCPCEPENRPVDAELVGESTHAQLIVGPTMHSHIRLQSVAYHAARGAFGTETEADDRRVYQCIQAYLHAERARVPDPTILYTTEEVVEAQEILRKHGGALMDEVIDQMVDVLLAAAPSQPEASDHD